MGDDWSRVQIEYHLSEYEMFELFNKPVLDNAVAQSQIIRFSHSPLEYSGSFLADEWEYLKNVLKLTDSNLHFEGGFWYVK
jgi:hypothetical protein